MKTAPTTPEDWKPLTEWRLFMMEKFKELIANIESWEEVECDPVYEQTMQRMKADAKSMMLTIKHYQIVVPKMFEH